MPRTRLHLTSADRLKLLMDHPPDGRPLSIRGLAARTGVSKSKIANLVNGGPYPSVNADAAARIAGALGVQVGVLFHGLVSTFTNKDKGDRHGPERTQPHDATGRTQELDEDH